MTMDDAPAPGPAPPESTPDSHPLISVVLPVYNAETFLDEAMDSLVQQRFKEFEVLAINDGSTDRSGVILDQWAARDPRIKPTHRENRGLCATLNEGLARAATLVARMDADDICAPDRLERQWNYLLKHPEVVCVGCARQTIDGRGRPLDLKFFPTTHDDIDHDHLSGWCQMLHPGVLMRRDAVLGIGGYDESYEVAQDLELWLRLAEVGRLANLPEVLMRYRVHDQAASTAKALQQVANTRRAILGTLQRRAIDAEPALRPVPNRSPKDRAGKQKRNLHLNEQALFWGYRRTAWVYAFKALGLPPTRVGLKALLRCLVAMFRPERWFTPARRAQRDAAGDWVNALR